MPQFLFLYTNPNATCVESHVSWSEGDITGSANIVIRDDLRKGASKSAKSCPIAGANTGLRPFGQVETGLNVHANPPGAR